ncbi:MULTISPECIES: hypothetical protein [Xanthomonas translucens group]|uniref:Uncharacterized protein n=1 Tax=Xanthomonas translucens pv. translucens DSM 18974 TaxID=1261556 RepID=A0A1C3TM30_XANCT|nr:hypothetical protein [Xanthomonas translucens]MCC8445679.1 hypothetical protein [Xanthomonas translucens pv. translucens]MCT8286288.1 hypothetical protein [Xanthomonas translucens pv. translucens]MCT8303946.1 hypothetical protein [Xanthomonas translucens pv. translucens]UKE48507.1 hypothetical protein KHA79_07880 [Xanthomonas translucens pv. cerealis]UNT99576.1 hypothetical protein KBQ49_02345 [Xanthomonas translucens pv. translucens]
MSEKKGITRLTDYTQPDAYDDLIIQVCDALQAIVVKLQLRAESALNAVRSGVLGIEPRRAYDYLLGVFHALVGQGQIDDESWWEIDAQLDRLDIAA